MLSTKARAFAALVVVGTIGLAKDARAQGAPTFLDETFVLSNWTHSKISDTTNAGTATASATFEASGGNPGSYRRVRHDWCGTGGTSQGLAIAHLRPAFVWDPAVMGPIDSLDYSLDVIFAPYLGNPGAVAYVIAVAQGAHVYGIYGLALTANWTTLSGTRVHVSDFNAYTVAAPPLDFSATGAPLTFGYVTGNATGGNECLVTHSGIDNYSVTITSTTPLPPVDAGVIDSGEVDSGEMDSGAPDTGDVDAGEIDASSADAVATDMGPADTGAIADAGTTDALPSTDAGAADAGPRDTGVADAGTISTSPPAEESGCGCRAQLGASAPRGATLPALVFLLALFGRRRSFPRP